MFPLNNPNDSRELYERLRLVFEEAPIGIYSLNKDGVIDSFNPEMVKLAGAKKASDVIGLNALTMPTYLDAGLTEYFKKGLAGEPFVVSRVKYKSQTGSKVSYRSYKGIPLKDNNGQVWKLLLFVVDITQEVEIESAREEAKRLATIVEQSPDAILITTPDNERIINYWNKGAEAMFGWKKDEVLGKPLYETTVGAGQAAEVKQFTQTLLQKKVIHQTGTRLNKNKQTMDVDMFIFPIVENNGDVTRFAAIMRDISQRKKFEDQLVESESKLKKINDTMVGRELRMVELKKEIERLHDLLKKSNIPF